MSSSDSSSLSEPPASDDERMKRKSSPKLTLKLKNGKLNFGRRDASPQSSPEPTQVDLGREPSPAHEYVLADNPDIAVIVMFRSRFADAFPQTVSNVGPQDLEMGVVPPAPSEQVEDLLCGLLGLVLNRKKNPERGHYNRAVEEALSSQKHQWPSSWKGVNPIPGSKSFHDLDLTARIDFLKTLVHWSLTTSEIIQSIIKESYKQARHEDDVNQPLSVQPWGLDTRKRKHYLIEGQVDSPFRVYRESEKKAREHTWKSVAGSIEDAQKLARDLRAETGQLPHRLAAKITQAVPLFEEKAEKRKRKEYRLSRKAAFARPEPGMSLYEGRTRGKRMNYAFDDDEIYGTDEMSTRRSERQSRVSTPADGPTFTASGRQVRSQFGKSYGEPSRLREGGSSTRASTRASSEAQDDPRGDGRARRSGRAQKAFGAEDFDSPDKLGNDDDDRATSGDQWDGDDEDMEGKLDEDEADEESDAGSEDSLGLEPPRSLVVKLRCGERLSGLNLANGQSTVPTAAHNHQSPRHTTDSQQPTTNDYSSPITNPSTSTPAPPIPSTVANAEQALDRPLQVSPSIPQQPRSQQSAGYPSHGAIKPLHQTTTRVPMLTTAAVHPLSSNAKEYPAQNRAAGAQPDQDTTGHPNQHPSHPSPANSHPAPSVTNGVQRPQQPARIPQSTHYSSHVNGY